MRNELKPCPFCGGKGILLENLNNPENHRYTASCNDCACDFFKGRATNKEIVINEWNTRQSDFDWKPIEELSLKVLKENKEILLYDDSSYIGYVCNNKEYLKAESIEFPVHYKNIKNYATHYTLLTPPKTNQSNK